MSICASVLAAALLQAPPLEDLYLEKVPDPSYALAVFSGFTQGAKTSPGSHEISWRRSELASDGSYIESKNTYSTRYRIVSMGSREGGRETYLAGILPSGSMVIEEWTFPLKVGRWDHSYTGSAQSIGTPTAAYTGQTNIVGGGAFVPPPATWYPPRIRVVLESPAYGYVSSIAVDPEGRFLLFSSYPSSAVYQVDLSTSPPVVTLIADPTSNVDLMGIRSLGLADHADHGRVCVVAPSSPLWASAGFAPGIPKTVVYLTDSDNDGLFESSITVPLDVYTQSTTDFGFLSGNPSLLVNFNNKWSTPWSVEW